MRYCHCHDDGYESRRMLAQAFWYSMTDFYAVFRKTSKIQFLFWTLDHNETVDVRMPKHHEDNYAEKVMQFKKECVALVDQGYTNGNVTTEVIEKWRAVIAEYQQAKGEVWE